MLAPEKHLLLRNSVLGVGAAAIRSLDAPTTFTELHKAMLATRELPKAEATDVLLLALGFLYSLNRIELLPDGRICRCDS